MDIPVYTGHLLCDENGLYPAELNLWEQKVLACEYKRDGFRFWYRNPKRPSQDSLGIAYSDGDVIKIVRPDFIFFREENGELVADIVDPHSIHLSDALPKLRGLAKYAAENASVFRRIEAISELSGKLRVLDLTRAEVQKGVLEAKNAESLYKGTLAGDFE